MYGNIPVEFENVTGLAISYVVLLQIAETRNRHEFANTQTDVELVNNLKQVVSMLILATSYAWISFKFCVMIENYP